MSVRKHPVTAVLRRNFSAYFASPTGYVFVTIFLAATAFLAFNSTTFFANNLADFGALNALFHWLPVVFVPAITMTAWAEERKLGTEELLLTLPVRDLEVVVGKSLSALGIYTVMLAFALSHALVLAYLGDPDWGLVFANFVGYWLVGAALIPLGLVASALTSNVTVAFILGSALCLAAVFAEHAVVLLPFVDQSVAEGIGVRAHLEDMLLGVVSLPDVLYFVLLIMAALYVNMVLLGRRHWGGGQKGAQLWCHYLVRVASVVVVAVSVSMLAGRWMATARADTTAEGLNSVSAETRRLIKALPGERPVYIQAFVSREVPEPYVRQREGLLRMLRQIDTIGGRRVVVTVNETELHSDQARRAELDFDIRPQRVMEMREGRFGSSEIFLAVAMTCGPEQVTIPFLDRGLSPEYELVRSIRVAARAGRKKVGVLATDAKLYGGFDMATMNMEQPWQIVEELKKQYEVVEARPDYEIDEDIDVLVAALPSSLTQQQMDVVADYIRSGRPILMLIDPLPISRRGSLIALSPSQPKRPPQRNPMMGPQQQPPEQKGDFDGLLAMAGLRWENDAVVWDDYNPLPKALEVPREAVCVSEKAGGKEPFNRDQAATAKLERVLLLFPGSLSSVPGTSMKVEPLLSSSPASGTLRWNEIISMSFFGQQLNPMRRYRETSRDYVLAARVTGELPDYDDDGPAEASAELGAGEDGKGAGPKRLNAIVVADLDMVGEEAFGMHRSGERELNFDNITFVLNCVDSLAGDADLIALRSRRPQYRTLARIEQRRQTYRQELLKEEEMAEKEAEERLEEAQKRLDDKVEALKKRDDIDAKTKAIRLDALERVENNRFDAAKAAIEARKEARIRAAEQQMHAGVRRIENKVRLWTVVLPPLPALAIGLVVFVLQVVRERKGTPLTRAMRQNP